MNWDYRDLAFYERMFSEMLKNPDFNREPFEAKIISMKRKLRANNKRANDRVIVRDDGIDGYAEKFPLPYCITTPWEADEYFREYEYIRLRPSAYDCTGQSFTAWYKIFRKPDGSFWAYHSIAYDF